MVREAVYWLQGCEIIKFHLFRQCSNLASLKAIFNNVSGSSDKVGGV